MEDDKKEIKIVKAEEVVKPKLPAEEELLQAKLAWFGKMVKK